MTNVERLLKTARAEIGYLEKKTNARLNDPVLNAGYNNFTKYAAFLDELGVVYNGAKNGYSWCDVFVDWCFIVTFGLDLGMELTYQPKRGAGASATFSMQCYKGVGSFFKTLPQPGDQIFFTADGGKSAFHTGIVEKIEGGRVYTIEGNTSAASGVVANGGGVSAKSYALDYEKIAGYGHPKWSAAVIKEESMTQDEFNKRFAVAMAAYRAELQDNDSAEYSKEARRFAGESGIIEGGGLTTAGEANYMWQDFVTREQLAAVLFRYDRYLKEKKEK